MKAESQAMLVAAANPLAGLAKRKLKQGENLTPEERRAYNDHQNDLRAGRIYTLQFESVKERRRYDSLRGEQSMKAFILENVERGIATKDQSPDLVRALQKEVRDQAETIAYLRRYNDELQAQTRELTEAVVTMVRDAEKHKSDVLELTKKVKRGRAA